MTSLERKKMLAFDKALEIVLGSAFCIGTESAELNKAAGRVLAQDVVSDVDMPPFNKSAMDGFACRRADLANELAVIETIPAGYEPKKTIGTNECAKIMTGAVVPDSADCVIMVEYTQSCGEDKIRFVGKETKDNICLRAEDVKAGQLVLSKGIVIKPQHIALLASVGCARVTVAKKPRVAVMATGNELVGPDCKPGPCEIRNSNSPQLFSQANSLADVQNYGIIADEKAQIDNALKDAMTENDVVILSGGVSAGDYDFVPEVMKQNNLKIMFEKVAVQPGKPVVFALGEKKACFGLPGNPVSAFVQFEFLIRPFLYKMMGHDYRPMSLKLPLAKSFKRKKAKKDLWIPAVITENGTVEAVEYHGSAHMHALCHADCLVGIEAGVAELKQSAIVNVRII